MESTTTPLLASVEGAGAALTQEAGWTVPAHFGDPRVEYQQAIDDAVIFDQSHRGKVELTGAEAGMFLHNLCTNDIANLPVGAGCEAFLTNAKARVVAHLRVYHLLLHDDRDALWLDVAPGQAEAVIKHLDHYLISEQVEFADRTREFAQIMLAGPRALTVLGNAAGTDLPDLEEHQHMMRAVGAAGLCHIRRNDALGVPGYDVVCLRARAPAVWQALLQFGAAPAGTEAYEILRIEAGTPVFGADIDEERFVVETGRIQQAICYTKGCFLGQEPIVMARDRGHVNRTLLGVKLGDAPAGQGIIPRGSKLLRDGNEVGQTASSTFSPRLGMTIALAYLRRGSQEPGTVLEIAAETGACQAEVVSLPFTAPVPPKA